MLVSLERNLLQRGAGARADTNLIEQAASWRQNLLLLAAQYNDMRSTEVIRAFTARGLPPQVNVTVNVTVTMPLPKNAKPPSRFGENNPDTL
jgi:hypothetical protein